MAGESDSALLGAMGASVRGFFQDQAVTGSLLDHLKVRR